MSPTLKKKTTIGWTEYLEIPDWKITRLQAKVDTGARTSALHVENIQRLKNNRVRFEVVLSRKNPERRIKVIAPVVKWARVRSSTGDYSMRCFVRTRIRLGGIEKEIDVTLVSRERMLFRMLLGRKALEGDFIVDVAKRKTMKKAARKLSTKEVTNA